jgi:ankyrin repeat protein
LAGVSPRLLANHADVNARDKDGWTPLHFAANEGNNAVVEMPLHSNANANVKSDGGYTPLQFGGFRRSQEYGETAAGQ